MVLDRVSDFGDDLDIISIFTGEEVRFLRHFERYFMSLHVVGRARLCLEQRYESCCCGVYNVGVSLGATIVLGLGGGKSRG